MNNKKIHYIIDTKLISYTLFQTRRDITGFFDEVYNILSKQPTPHHVYFVSDIGKSEYRLNISSYYKGKRSEERVARALKNPQQKVIDDKFAEDYLKLVALLSDLPTKLFTNIVVDNVEADDTASILCNTLSQDTNNRISLVTRDQDWLHSVIDTTNVKILSPYHSEDDKYAEFAKLSYNVRNRNEFTLRKALFGDTGDSILGVKFVGDKAANTIWSNVQVEAGENPITLDMVYENMMLWINSQKNPARYIVHPKYIEHNVVPAGEYKQLLETNYALGRIIIELDELSTEQQEQYNDSISRTVPSKDLDMFNIGIEVFGRPILIQSEAKAFYECKA